MYMNAKRDEDTSYYEKLSLLPLLLATPNPVIPSK